MKAMKKFTVVTLCLAALVLPLAGGAANVSARQIGSAAAAQRAALSKVGSSAHVIEVDTDMDKGVLCYDVELLKGGKTYTLKYNSRTGALVEYGWEVNLRPGGWNDKFMSKSAIQRKAKNKVGGGSVINIHRDYDDGRSEYDIKIQKGNKRYELVYAASNGKLLEYKWETFKNTSSSGSSSGYISAAKAKSIALNQVPGARVLTVEYEYDDGMKVYDVKLIKGMWEYDFTIDSRTGNILERDQDHIYD